MVVRKKKKVVKSSTDSSRSRKYIRAAEEDEFDDFEDIDDGDSLMDAIDDVADNVEDLQDAVDDIIDEDQVEIVVNNNIADHFIAECDACNGIFISAVVDSDQDIDHVSGTCPLCGKESDQFLKWIIRDASEKDNTKSIQEVISYYENQAY